MNRFLTASAALVAIAALSAAPAFAAAATTTKAPVTHVTKAAPAKVAAKPAATKGVLVNFKTLDTNKDGKISLAELQKVWPKLTKADFAKFDANKDGFYNHAELAAYFKSIQPPKTSALTSAAKPAKK